MGEAPGATAARDAEAPYVGGAGVVLNDLGGVLFEIINPAVEAFNKIHQNNQMISRINKSMIPDELGQSAAAIAARAQGARNLGQDALADVVRLETNKATAQLQRKVASLQGQLDATKSGKKKGKGGGKQDFRRRGKTAGRKGAPNQTRAGAAGPGTAAGAGAKNGKGAKHSNGKSAGKKRANKTGKRS